MTPRPGTDITRPARSPTARHRRPGGFPLFCDTALAARIERAEAQRIAGCSAAARRRSGTVGFVIPLAGGVASFAGDGSSYSKVAGLGFAGAPGPDALGEIERASATLGAPTQIELAHLADPEIAAGLTARGYQLEWFENVLGRALSGHVGRVIPAGIEVRPSGADETGAWLDVVAEGSVHPDQQGVPWHEEFSRETIIEAERDAAEADLQEQLDREINAFNVAATDHRDLRELSVAARSDDGDLRGGLYGWTWGGCGYVDLLWVRDDQRGLGLGAQLLTAAEGEIRRRGCDRVALNTRSFQAPGFYGRLGCTECGRTPGYPHDYGDIHLLKLLP